MLTVYLLFLKGGIIAQVVVTLWPADRGLPKLALAAAFRSTHRELAAVRGCVGNAGGMLEVPMGRLLIEPSKQ